MTLVIKGSQVRFLPTHSIVHVTHTVRKRRLIKFMTNTATFIIIKFMHEEISLHIKLKAKDGIQVAMVWFVMTLKATTKSQENSMLYSIII